jgi:hypothetical protein
MPGGTTKVTFKVECALAPGERLGLIIHGEFGRLLEVVLASSGRMHFTHPIPLATLDRVEYSYAILSDTQSMVRGRGPAAQTAAPATCEPRARARARRPSQRPPNFTRALTHARCTRHTRSWARRGTAPWSPRA